MSRGASGIVLPEALASRLASGHPWVYRDHIPRSRARTGDWVKIVAGSFEAYGLWDEESPIAVRIFSSEKQPDRAFFRARVEDAWALRAPLRENGVTGCRLINGEGDGLPGVVVDSYQGYAVLQTYSKSLETILPHLVAALSDVAEPKGVLRRLRKEDGVELEVLSGEAPHEDLFIEEYGMRLGVDLIRGQKTGLFFDHRENRRWVRGVSAGRSVLNLFSYTGGFSVAAALGGARSVTSVDIAEGAVRAVAKNFELNGLEAIPHDEHAEDVFAFLERAAKKGQRWDVVISDPPSFAKNREQKRAAERAYVKLMGQALRVVSPGGIFCAASCTSQVSPNEFRFLLSESGRKARIRGQILHEIGHATDHPIALGHEEGRYLKFIALRVGPRV
ncbi:MAG: hypothetical protein B6A08_03500 [Sorangiineae bacterium NIC37A_2]|nr:MAG: hypothetical protein B6A08_03500 [Sorangiineae bacterium NIC37A_2]